MLSKDWFCARRVCTAGLTLGLATGAHASYNGLSAELHTTVTIDGTARSVFRVYANFTDASDRLQAVYGSATLGPLTLQSINGGGSFYNAPGAGITSPAQEQIDLNPNVAWDSFVTIGVSVQEQAPFGDMTSLTPGFPPLAGSNYVSTNAGWYLTPDIDHDNDDQTAPIINPQAEAGFLDDGDVLPRVLIAQLTVNAGGHVAGTANIVVWQSDGQGGGASSILAEQTFTSIPAPGALALLAIAGLRARRRR